MWEDRFDDFSILYCPKILKFYNYSESMLTPLGFGPDSIRRHMLCVINEIKQ